MGDATVPLAGGYLLASFVSHNDQGVLNHDAHHFGVGYLCPLSKRTSLYTAFARLIDKNGATFTVGNATETGAGNKAFNLSAVHNF